MAHESSPDKAGAILRAVSYSVKKFSTATRWEEVILDVLGYLGAASEASRVYLYKNFTDELGRLCQDLVFEWSAPGVTPTLDIDWTHGWPYSDGYLHYQDTLGSGGVISTRASDVGEMERADYAEVGILSAMFVPVFASSEWWGYMGYDDCVSERSWTSTEVEVLRTAAETLGAAIYRNLLEDRLSEEERRYGALLEGTSVVTDDERSGE